MVLTDDNFATIVAAVEAGRRVYDNVRKFILYIFAHATPEVVPFLVFALSGGAVPLPLTVMQILAIDLGTETLPALALGREPAEPGADGAAAPTARRRASSTGRCCMRAWLLLGGISAALVMAGFFFVLLARGLAPGRPDRRGRAAARGLPPGDDDDVPRHRRLPDRHRLRGPHRARLAARGRASLSNRLLLWGIAFELAFAAAIVTIGPLQAVFHTAVPAPEALLPLLFFP